MDDKTTVLGTSGFIDNTIRSHGTHKQYQCISVLADAKNSNQFHVENVDCSKKAKVICRIDLDSEMLLLAHLMLAEFRQEIYLFSMLQKRNLYLLVYLLHDT